MRQHLPKENSMFFFHYPDNDGHDDDDGHDDHSDDDGNVGAEDVFFYSSASCDTF